MRRRSDARNVFGLAYETDLFHDTFNYETQQLLPSLDATNLYLYRETFTDTASSVNSECIKLPLQNTTVPSLTSSSPTQCKALQDSSQRRQFRKHKDSAIIKTTDNTPVRWRRRRRPASSHLEPFWRSSVGKDDESVFLVDIEPEVTGQERRKQHVLVPRCSQTPTRNRSTKTWRYRRRWELCRQTVYVPATDGCKGSRQRPWKWGRGHFTATLHENCCWNMGFQ